MFLIGFVELCEDYGLVTFFEIFQKIMHLMQIIVPIIAIVAMVKLLTQLVIDPENKKLKNGFKNWLISLVVFFMLPFIINTVMGLVEDDYTIGACWQLARERKASNNGYISTYDYNNYLDRN